MEGYGFEDDIELDIDLGKVQQRHLGNLLLEVSTSTFYVHVYSL